jgi:hypothetical protein
MQGPMTGHEPVVVQLNPPAVQVPAGGLPVELQANIRNAGDTVDQYSIEVENLDPSWFTITEQSVALFPGDSAPIVIRIHPPKNSQTRAGSYKFVVRARSHADPSIVGTTKGEVVVGGYTNFQMELAPKRATGYRGKYRLMLQNGGNGEANLELSGRDPEMNLSYRFRPSNPVVPAGSKNVVPVTIKPQGMRLVGQQTTHRFIINARPTDGDEKDAKEVQGELVHKPLFRGWKWPVVLLLLGLLFFGFLLFRPTINPCSRAFFMAPLPSGAAYSARFYYGFLCDGENFRIGGPAEQTLSEEECNTAEGFSQIREDYEGLIGQCVETEWYDRIGNSHQRTNQGRLMYIPPAADRASEIYFFADDKKVYTFVPTTRDDFRETELVEIIRK